MLTFRWSVACHVDNFVLGVFAFVCVFTFPSYAAQDRTKTGNTVPTGHSTHLTVDEFKKRSLVQRTEYLRNYIDKVTSDVAVSNPALWWQ
jgi:hypothetical protein